MRHHKKQSGFALLLTLIVVNVLVAVGLTILDVSIKQLRLSTNSRDSEIAFHAANAGLECMRFWRRVSSSTMEQGGANVINPFDGNLITCFGDSPDDGVAVPPQIIIPPAANGSGAWLYRHRFTWGQSNDRCTVATTLIIRSSATAPLSVTGMPSLVPGFPDGDTKVCEASGRCTVMSVQGHNQDCPSSGANFSLGTVQREVLLQF